MRNVLSNFIMLFILLLSLNILAKDLAPKKDRSEHKVIIQVDGLACYFCAYGLERFFKKSGAIAWYDINIKTAQVEIVFKKTTPIFSIQKIEQIIHDAGYTGRDIAVELIGQIKQKEKGQYFFTVEDTGVEQILPLDENNILKDFTFNRSQQIGQRVRVKATAIANKGSVMKLKPTEIQLAPSLSVSP